jgi:hypothetical protein
VTHGEYDNSHEGEKLTILFLPVRCTRDSSNAGHACTIQLEKTPSTFDEFVIEFLRQ